MSKLDDLSKQFDAAYFAGGENKGNAYKDNHYLDTALLSRAYFEMAEIIAKCFKPTKMLEIGCAAGPTIYHLNTFFDIDAHGIDASKWAVENRLHPHVRHASADNLPYNTGEFDLVFSCHTLEHLTLGSKDSALLEMDRVCKSNGIQYHLMPILESGPYADDTFGSIVGLRKDITHNLLRNREWWLSEWSKLGWNDAGLRVCYIYDNHGFEFSDCQLILSRQSIKVDLAIAVANRNQLVARAFLRALTRRPLPGLEVFLNEIRDNWK